MSKHKTFIKTLHHSPSEYPKNPPSPMNCHFHNTRKILFHLQDIELGHAQVLAVCGWSGGIDPKQTKQSTIALTDTHSFLR